MRNPCHNLLVDRTARIFTNFEDAERADEDYYASLSPNERVEVLLAIVEQYRSSLGESAERFERVCRIVKREQS